jgi:hypothetical protein
MLRSLRTGNGPTMNRIRIALLATLIALLAAVAPVHAASCNGASHELALSNGTTTPGSVTLGSPMTFTVTYTDTADCAPSAITLTIGGVGTFPLNAGGTTYSAGVTYWITLTLPAGSHPYAYDATSGSGRGEKSVTLSAVDPVSALVVIPPPPPPPPTPAPTPTPVPPAVTPPPPSPPTSIAPPGPTTPATPASVAPAPSATPVPEPSVSPEASPALGLFGAHDSWSPAPTGHAAASILPSGSPAPRGSLMAWAMAALAGLVGLVLLLARRRRAEQKPALAGAAPGASVGAAPTTPTTAPDAARVTPLPPMRELIPPVDPDLLREPDSDELSADEARVPRWLRTGVQAARRGPQELRNRNWH